MRLPKLLVLGITSAALMISIAGFAGDTKEPNSPYAGQEKRQIKTLSEREVNGYLNGHGMGFAKVVELNHFPGPKHVLELSDELNLSAYQHKRAESIFDEMHTQAVKLGATIVNQERSLDSLCADQLVTDSSLYHATVKIAALQGELRYTHMRAHLQMVKIMSEGQIRTYDQLRGYVN